LDSARVSEAKSFIGAQYLQHTFGRGEEQGKHSLWAKLPLQSSNCCRCFEKLFLFFKAFFSSFFKTVRHWHFQVQQVAAPPRP
jgi:hypothetical protein